MKIGFMGTEVRITRVKEVLSRRFPELDKHLYIEETYEYLERVADELRILAEKVDGFLFCGKLQYELYRDIFDGRIPCGYLRKDDSALKTALLTLQGNGVDIRRISVDNYSYASLKGIYEDSGFSYDELQILKRENFRIHSKGYYEVLIKEHTRLYEEGLVNGALTTLSFVYERLKTAGIPCAYVIPSYDSMIRDIQNVLHMCEYENENDPDRICCMMFHLSPDLGNNISGQNAYLFNQAKLHAAEELSYFAQNIYAMMIAQSDEDYTLICQTQALMDYSRDLHVFPVLQMIHDNCRLDYFVGIGFGKNPADAGHHAKLARKKAQKEEHDGVFICYNPQLIHGPMEYVNTHEAEELEEQEYLEDISQKTGISVGKLKQLMICASHSDGYTVTVKSLAEDMNLSIRVANRLLNRLEEFQLVEVIGKVPSENAGRPANVFRVRICRPT